MSLRSLCERDEVIVFEPTETQDTMMNDMESSATKRRKVKCRMVEMSRQGREEHGVPALVKAYTACFATDPAITLAHRVVYKNEAYEVLSSGNNSNQGWLWTVDLSNHPGVEITV